MILKSWPDFSAYARNEKGLINFGAKSKTAIMMNETIITDPVEPPHEEDWVRLVIAFVLAPLVPVSPVALVLRAAFIWVFGLPLSYGCAIFVGLPIFLYLRLKGHKITLKMCIWCGFAAGFILPAIILSYVFWLHPTADFFMVSLISVLLLGCCGAIAGFAFAKIAAIR
jgi:hypothetical protein